MRRFRVVTLVLVALVAGQGASQPFPGRAPQSGDPVNSQAAVERGPTGSLSQEERFVAIAPCRLEDTRLSAPKAGETSLRIDVSASRCGRIVPSAAVAFAVRVSPIARSVNNAPPAARAVGTVVRHPLPAPLVIPIPAPDHIAVDLEGYYVPPGFVTDPRVAPGTNSTGQDQAGQEQSVRASRVGANANPDGQAGKIFLDGDAPTFYGAGVMAMAKTTDRPWTIVHSTDTGGTGRFGYFNGNGEIFSVHSNGYMRLPAGTFMSGRSVYYNGPIEGNVVHEVRIPNPRDAAGTAGQSVVFFRAHSDGEDGSPSTTKFQAYTTGTTTQTDKLHINFDSQVYYAWPAGSKNYHFRAYSANVDQPSFTRETFSVVAALNSASLPTADMYVSGNVTVDGSITGAKVLNAVFQDLAEWVPATSDMAPGTVVVLNPSRTNEVMPSAAEYDTRVAGVVSAQPGIVLGVAAEAKEMIATTGRVKVKVDATRAPIAVGDLLVSSAKPGVAMKSNPIDLAGVSIHRPGTIIGKALEPLPAGEGEILVLLSLQ